MMGAENTFFRSGARKNRIGSRFRKSDSIGSHHGSHHDSDSSERKP